MGYGKVTIETMSLGDDELAVVFLTPVFLYQSPAANEDCYSPDDPEAG